MNAFCQITVWWCMHGGRANINKGSPIRLENSNMNMVEMSMNDLSVEMKESRLCDTRRSAGVRNPGRMPGACVLHASVPVTCNLSRAVTLPNIAVPHLIGVPHYIGVPHRVPSNNRCSSIAPSTLTAASNRRCLH